MNFSASKIFLIGMVVMLGVLVGEPGAQNVVTADSVVVAWDAVSPPVDSAGQPYAGVMKYQLYVRRDTPGTAPEKLGSVNVATSTVTMPSPGKWWVGVSAFFTFSAFGNEVRESNISWSDNPAAVQNGQTFVVIYLPSPAAPGGLRK